MQHQRQLMTQQPSGYQVSAVPQLPGLMATGGSTGIAHSAAAYKLLQQQHGGKANVGLDALALAQQAAAMQQLQQQQQRAFQAPLLPALGQANGTQHQALLALLQANPSIALSLGLSVAPARPDSSQVTALHTQQQQRSLSAQAALRNAAAAAQPGGINSAAATQSAHLTALQRAVQAQVLQQQQQASLAVAQQAQIMQAAAALALQQQQAAAAAASMQKQAQQMQAQQMLKAVLERSSTSHATAQQHQQQMMAAFNFSAGSAGNNINTALKQLQLHEALAKQDALARAAAVQQQQQPAYHASGTIPPALADLLLRQQQELPGRAQAPKPGGAATAAALKQLQLQQAAAATGPQALGNGAAQAQAQAAALLQPAPACHRDDTKEQRRLALACVALQLARSGVSVEQAIQSGVMGGMSITDVRFILECYTAEHKRMAGAAGNGGGLPVSGPAGAPALPTALTGGGNLVAMAALLAQHQARQGIVGDLTATPPPLAAVPSLTGSHGVPSPGGSVVACGAGAVLLAGLPAGGGSSSSVSHHLAGDGGGMLWAPPAPLPPLRHSGSHVGLLASGAGGGPPPHRGSLGSGSPKSEATRASMGDTGGSSHNAAAPLAGAHFSAFNYGFFAVSGGSGGGDVLEGLLGGADGGSELLGELEPDGPLPDVTEEHLEGVRGGQRAAQEWDAEGLLLGMAWAGDGAVPVSAGAGPVASGGSRSSRSAHDELAERLANLDLGSGFM